MFNEDIVSYGHSSNSMSRGLNGQNSLMISNISRYLCSYLLNLMTGLDKSVLCTRKASAKPVLLNQSSHINFHEECPQQMLRLDKNVNKKPTLLLVINCPSYILPNKLLMKLSVAESNPDLMP